MNGNLQKTKYTAENFDVSVIIVNWNSGKYLQETIESLFEKNTDLTYETIIVDNCSNKDEESYLYLEEVLKYDNVTVIKSEENLGFSKANNVGMETAKGRNFLILNPDIIFKDNCLKTLCDYLDNNDKAGMTGPKILNINNEFQQNCIKGRPYPKDTLFHIIGLAKAFPNKEYFNGYAMHHIDKTKIQECWALSGCCMMVKRELYDKIGGIDEQFFMYQEETDWGIRCKDAGYSVVYNPNSTVIHYGGVTTKKVKIKSIWIFTQSMMKFFKKHFWNKYNIFQKAFWTVLIYGNFFLKLTIAKVRGK
ncbi:MAG: glycosyltransferase family 2 protein [Candidatus Gastranaerophilales bacterium]|nr:glycosyltransferase family 2 protein [Candidatus Gastranaerophilales bacterium]